MEQFNYLYMAALALPNTTEAHKVLKSHYMSRSRELFGFDRESRELKFNPTRTCSRCNCLWSDGGCRMSFTSRGKGRCKNPRKSRRLVSKYYKYGMHSGKFTRMARFMARKLCRQVSLVCNLCSFKQTFYIRPKLRKTTSRQANSKPRAVTVTEDATVKGKKKKNKKKFAGLDEGVMSDLKEGRPQNSTTTQQTNQNKKQTKNNANFKYNKKGPKGGVQKQGNDPKPISRQNISQLAMLLKNKDNKGSANRLEMMFK